MTTTEIDQQVDERTEYIAGLRAMADILEGHSEMPLPWPGQSENMTFEFYVTGDENEKATTAAIIRAVGGRWSKNATDAFFTTATQLRGLHIRVVAHRDQVCERRVIGTETVVKKVATVFEEREVEQDIIEWDCGPILADAR